jgi:putative ABC transport system substrate-binding protein
VKRREFITVLSGVAVWPFAAHAQRQVPTSTRVGFLPLGSPSNNFDLSLVEAFRKGVSDGGLLEDRDLILDVVWIGSGGEYPEAVTELIRRGAAILVTAGSSASSAANSRVRRSQSSL